MPQPDPISKPTLDPPISPGVFSRHHRHPHHPHLFLLKPPWPRPYDRTEPEMPSTKTLNGSNQFPQKLKNFFRINSFVSSNGDRDRDRSGQDQTSPLKSESKSTFRNTAFFKTTVGRLRTNTTASEGNPLDESLSPTAHANPYFVHQGQPGLRHHDDGSVPPSPPDTPSLKVHGPPGGNEQVAAGTKEELARKLRRVASAPNAQGLFSKGKGSADRPATAELSKDPLIVNKKAGTLGFVETKANGNGTTNLGVPDKDGLGALPSPNRNPMSFRRTYSSNSIKVRNVEVGPQSFDKIKLIGKGDVGKVYLVREKKSSRLYAMKGMGSELLRYSSTTSVPLTVH
jgi:protein-serine/threonine kinase